MNPQSTGPSLPGPTIEANEGDIIRVKVTNLNPFTGSSVHWHGIHQLNTQFMDGVAGITQCQLQPKSSQEFEFVGEFISVDLITCTHDVKLIYPSHPLLLIYNSIPSRNTSLAWALWYECS